MAQRQIKTSFDAAAQRLTWTIDGLEAITLELNGLAAEVRNRAMVFGLVQTVSDSAALAKGSTTGQKRAAMMKRIETLLSGKWSAERATGPREKPFNVGDVVLALARTKMNGDIDRANLAIDTYAGKHNIGRDASAKLFAQDEVVATEIARIERARVPVKFDADEAIAEAMRETEPAPESDDERSEGEELETTGEALMDRE